MEEAARNSSIEQEETSILVTTESKPPRWTNEKHRLFLKSMESTFVDQLHKSLNLFHKNSKSPKDNQTSNCASYGKYKDVGDGSTNSWINHSECSSQRGSIRKFQASSPTSTDNRRPLQSSQPHHQDHVDSYMEASGQNFNDEDSEEEKAGQTRIMKRTRNSSNVTLCNDQSGSSFRGVCPGGVTLIPDDRQLWHSLRES